MYQVNFYRDSQNQGEGCVQTIQFEKYINKSFETVSVIKPYYHRMLNNFEKWRFIKATIFYWLEIITCMFMYAYWRLHNFKTSTMSNTHLCRYYQETRLQKSVHRCTYKQFDAEDIAKKIRKHLWIFNTFDEVDISNFHNSQKCRMEDSTYCIFQLFVV